MVSGPSAFFSRKDKRAINFYTDHFNGIVAKRSADDTLAFRVEREMVNAASHFGKGISWTRSSGARSGALGLSCASGKDPTINPAMENMAKVLIVAPIGSTGQNNTPSRSVAPEL